jgi:uncharacterized protein
MSEAPREDLVRSVPFELTRTDDGDGLTLEGYAAVFNDWTEINSWEGHFLERILPGAFKKTLAERTPVLQFDHGSHPLIGSIPIGTITTAREDDRGLFIRARLSDNWLVQPVRDAIADGAVTGMSFRFSVPRDKDEWDNDATPPRRSIRETITREVGPVVWPAYESTTVGVRSKQIVEQLVNADDETRTEVAKVLSHGVREAAESTSPPGTSDPEAARTEEAATGTSEDHPDEPDDHSPDNPRLTAAQRRRKLAFMREHLSLIHGGNDG